MVVTERRDPRIASEASTMEWGVPSRRNHEVLITLSFISHIEEEFLCHSILLLVIEAQLNDSSFVAFREHRIGGNADSSVTLRPVPSSGERGKDVDREKEREREKNVISPQREIERGKLGERDAYKDVERETEMDRRRM